MKKQPLIITIAALILLAGVAYLAGSINTNKDKASAENDQINVIFGSTGYVLEKSIITKISDGLPQQQLDNKAEYTMYSPTNNTEKKLYSNSSSSREDVFVYNNKLIIRNQAESAQKGLVLSVDAQGVQTEIVDPIPSNLFSSDGSLSARRVITTGDPNLPYSDKFDKLVVENGQGSVVAEYFPQNFSSLEALMPIDFSEDNKNLLLSSGYLHPQEPFSEAKYFLQTIGGEKKELLSSPQVIDGQDRIFQLIGLSGNYAVGLEEWSSKGESNFTRRFFRMELESGKIDRSQVLVTSIIDQNEEDSVIKFIDATQQLAEYHILDNSVTILSGALPESWDSNYFFSADYTLYYFEKNYTRESSTQRGINAVNSSNINETVFEGYVYDMKNKTEKKIYSYSRHTGGDAIGDISYRFLGFIS